MGIYRFDTIPELVLNSPNFSFPHPQVQIPALTGHYPQGFTPDKLLPTPDEAKQYAAEYVLGRLQYPTQSTDGGE